MAKKVTNASPLPMELVALVAGSLAASAAKNGVLYSANEKNLSLQAARIVAGIQDVMEIVEDDPGLLTDDRDCAFARFEVALSSRQADADAAEESDSEDTDTEGKSPGAVKPDAGQKVTGAGKDGAKTAGNLL